MRVVNFNNQKFRFETRDEADESVLNEIYKYQEYRSGEKFIRSAKVIIDAGAHAGFFAVYCRALNSRAEIYCLEPVEENVKQIQKHLELNKVENVLVAEMALSNKTGKTNIYLSSDSHNHSLIPNNSTGIREVKTVSLNDFCQQNDIKEIDFLKMDIEGAEEFVIADIKNWPKVRSVMFEYHGQTKGLVKNLNENKYKTQVFPSQFDKKFGLILAMNTCVDK